MPLEIQVVLAGHLALGSMSFMLAFILLWFAPRVRDNHYRVWAWAWLAFAVYSLVGAASLWLAVQGPPSLRTLRAVLGAVAQGASTAGAFLIILGTLGSVRDQPVPRRKVGWAIGLGLALGAAVSGAVLAGLDPGIRAQYRSLLVSGAFLGSALLLVRAGRTSSRPARLLAGAMTGLGLMYAHYLVHGIVTALGYTPAYGLTILSLLELPFMAAIAAAKTALGIEDERRRTEGVIQRYEHRHHQILESLISGVFVMRDGRFSYVNEAFARTFGLTPAAVSARDPRSLVHADDGSIFDALVAPADREDPSRLHEFRGIRDDGRVVHLLAVSTSTEVDGEATLLGNLIDVTDRVRAEERDALLVAMLDAGPAGILISSEEGGTLFSNRRADEMCGLSREAVTGCTLRALIARADDERIGGALKRMPGGTEVSFEASASNGGAGGETPVHVTVRAVDWEGRRALLSVLTDLTSQRQAQADAERLGTAIEQSGELVMVTDADGVIQYVNPTFEQVTGYDRLEAIGRNPRFLQSGRHDAAFYRRLWETVLSGETWRGEFRNRRKDGSEYREDSTISPVRDASGAIISLVSVGRDMTEALEAREALAQSQRLESVGRLAGGIAHDFNNLLSIILGYSEMARNATPGLESVQADLEEVLAAAERAKNLTQQLLAFSRQQKLAPEVLNLGDVLSGLERMLARLVGEDLDLSIHVPAELDPVFGDPGRIEQVVMNLVVNARDAMPDGGQLIVSAGMVSVPRDRQVEELEPGPYVELVVSDTGVGMDPDTMEHVFEPFFTTKPEGHGTGLGLATVYGIVKQSLGAVEVESEVGRGTTFRVYLPSASETDRPAVHPGREAVSKRPGGTETILLVEDENDVRRLVERTLRDCGYDVVSAGTAGDARVLWEKRDRPIALLLTDVVMPHMNGPELAALLTADDPGLRVLFMSGYSFESFSGYGPGDAEPDVLAKPFLGDELARRVRAALDR